MIGNVTKTVGFSDFGEVSDNTASNFKEGACCLRRIVIELLS